jgi:adhesin transport system membrane fusion protein
MSVAPVELLSTPVAPARIARLMLWSIAVFTALMLGWAGLARVDETATASGRVAAASELQVVSHLEGGVLTAILVRPGDRVAAGQLLLRLDPGSADAELGRGTAASRALAARLARLEAEASGTVPRFDPALVAAAPAAVAAEAALWQSRQADLEAAAAGDAARLDAALRGLSEARTDASAAAEASAQAMREAAMLDALVEKGIEPAINRDRARSALIQANARAAGASAAVARAAAMVAEARAAARAGAARLRSQSGDALTLARAELAGQSAGLPALASRRDRTAIRSPVAGTVQRILATTIGAAVAPGVPLVEIVPAGDALVIDARVRPTDIGFLHPGQPARVKLTAYDSSVYGSLDGKVERISPDAIIDDRGGEGYFAVRIATTGSLDDAAGKPLAIAPGMIAEVNFRGRKRSILSYLLAPVTRLRENAFRER